ncbi:GNAT family N-acetyltransferase [Massilia sp. YIM B02443]|uniref:GNAT family N-acetyltransferase n=1 Tax=Massilia sp. YIM B02443 TaxID=3050127 RepID=UPI0025B70605|nr:GNAT family N-acetyltransferase [Massilia sp. YIM B02443]MDN4036067.1 GNAT family N-acetyltransferase [Massilia sp. YIM B02443]
MGVTLLTGADALERIGTDAFQSRWRTLYAACPWVTACQHPDFVLTWYRCYRARYLPVVVFDEDDGGALSGLLTLALHRGGRKLSGAGDHQAEYQGWMQRPDRDASFILAAIRALRSAYPAADLQLRYLPPGMPLDAFQAGGNVGAPFSLHRYRRPLMRIEAAAMARQRNKKNHRQNFNRLGRGAAVRFEHVVGHGEFVAAFDEMCMQYDFRQAALYRSMPFTDDPAKKPFYIGLHEKGMLHVSVLRVGEAIAASHIGLLTHGRAVHLGINTHDPACAAHSPGNLLLAMLGVHLADEHIPWLDLTPGGDRYKEHFATDHDVVFGLTVYANQTRRWRDETVLAATGVVKDKLQNAGYRPDAIMAAIQKLKHRGGMKVLYAALRRRAPVQAKLFRHGGMVASGPENDLSISRNRLHDVMRFDALGASFDYREFLSAAMRRMERSCDVYSHVRDGKLQICCWAQAGFPGAEMADAGMDRAPAADAIVLSNLYVHRDLGKDGLIRDFLLQIVTDLHGRKSDVSVYYRGVLDDALRTVMETCGFSEEARALACGRARNGMDVNRDQKHEYP